MKSLADVLGLNTPSSATTEASTTPRKLTAKAFSKAILESADYAASIQRRILADTLPPAVEVKLYEYAYGKPVDKVEVRDKTNPLEELTMEQLETRAMKLAALVAKLRGEAAQSVH